MKQKTCKACGEKFIPTRPFQNVCSYECAIKIAREYRIKQERKEKNRVKAEYKRNDKGILLKLAQKLFNEYIRSRDKNEPCISCGYVGNGRQWHAGHYRPTGRNGQLRFNEMNVHKQCSICNNHLSGNLVKYRESLIKKIGLEMVEELECNNEPKKYTVEELRDLILTYKIKIKEGKNVNFEEPNSLLQSS
jgi:hypothetical protein